MNDTDTNAVQTEAPAKFESKPTLQDVKLSIFPVDNMESAQTAMVEAMSLAEEAGVSPVFTFDSNAFPEGFEPAIIPMTKTIKDVGRVTQNICLAAIPSLDEILKAEGGEDWVRKTVRSELVGMLKRELKSDDEVLSLPASVHDFISSVRVNSLDGYNAAADTFLQLLKLKSKTLKKYLNKKLFRQCLESQAFAEMQFASITSDQWEHILKGMITFASKQGATAGIMQYWLDNRNQVAVDTSGIDLSDLDGLIEGTLADDDENEASEQTTQDGQAPVEQAAAMSASPTV